MTDEFRQILYTTRQCTCTVYSNVTDNAGFPNDVTNYFLVVQLRTLDFSMPETYSQWIITTCDSQPKIVRGRAELAEELLVLATSTSQSFTEAVENVTRSDGSAKHVEQNSVVM